VWLPQQSCELQLVLPVVVLLFHFVTSERLVHSILAKGIIFFARSLAMSAIKSGS
jgi:hypothetical protein